MTINIAFAQNWQNNYEINTNPDGEKRYARVAGGINNASPEGNEEESTEAYFDGDGQKDTEITGGQTTIAFSGHRKYNDPAQNYIASLAYVYGEARRTDFRWTMPDGTVLEGPGTVSNIKTTGGGTLDREEFSFDWKFSGAPTVYEADATTFPETITLEAVEIEEGATKAIVATITPEKASPALVYDTEDDDVADVYSDGTLVGVAPGKTKLRVKSAVKPTVFAEVEVTVTAKTGGVAEQSANAPEVQTASAKTTAAKTTAAKANA